MSMGIIASVGGALIGGIMAGDAADTAADAQNASTAAGSAAAARTAALAEKQDARAEEQWLRYKQVYAPAEDQMLDEAKSKGSLANQSKAASDAAAGVSAAFGNARTRLAKNPGVNPSSQQYLQESGKLALGEAATSAAAQTGAREAVKDKASVALTNAVSLGKGLPATAGALSGSAGGLLGSAAGMYGSLAAGARADGQAAGANAAGIGKMVGGVFGSSAVKNWMNSPDATFGGAIPAGTAPAAAAFGGGGQMDDLASYGVF